ncbi:uncharacterized protein uimc1 [Thalassophryne amazonica]|uniref:uncharacterized protein uimc1 n=1 Tax=Thalassophryne amazonica TaxID=390379 RepID=UPI001472003A|nr:uncharacterized protein uimc1 [Thalassophryne amazonica]
MRRTRGRQTVTLEGTTRALRQQVDKDDDGVSSGSQPIEEETQEDDALDDEKTLSSSRLQSLREKRRRGREKQSKEMTEKEMMDFALRLSEQEACVAAVKYQQEEEAVLKAIEESMVSEMQPSSQPESQSLHADADASVTLASQRRIFRLNRKKASMYRKGVTGSSVTSKMNLNRAPKGTEDENMCQNKKRKREDGSRLLETMDFCQTQKLCKQPSPDRTEAASVPLDSPQSSNSTQLDDSQLPKSLVFQEESCRAEVHVRRLTPDLLKTYRFSGFVSCSQDSWTLIQKTQPKSPTFPKSPAHTSNQAWSKSTPFPDSPLLSEGDPGDDVEMEHSPEYIKSPTFGRNSPDRRFPNTCLCQHGVCHTACESSGFTFCSLDSLTSSVGSTACRIRSPVFPSSPEFSKNCNPHDSPAFLKDVEVGDPESEEASSCRSHRWPTRSHGPLQSLKANRKTDLRPDDSCNRRCVPATSDNNEEEEMNETGKDWNSGGQVITSNMTLNWSDEDDDDETVVDSPSPVFPEEKHLHQNSQASPKTNCRLNPHSCDPVISSKNDSITVDQKGSDQRVAPPLPSTSTCIPDPELQPGSSWVPVGAAGTSAGQTTVHYYWGVPFCPRGLDPNAYTQVIVAQLEVYEKSVKWARRSLLKKAEWGEPVLPRAEKFPSPHSPGESPPQQISRRQGLRLRGKKPTEAAAAPPPEPEEEKDGYKEEEEQRGQDTDDCDVCPETPQLSEKDGDSTPELTVAADAGEEIQPESPELPQILSGDSAGHKEAPQEDMEVDAGVAGREPEENVAVDSSVRGEEAKEEGRDLGVQELKDGGGQRSASPEVEITAAPQSPEPVVDCPICQKSFRFTQIELHAAYCDGEAASTTTETRPGPDCFQGDQNLSVKPRRVRTKRVDEESVDSYTGNKTSHNLEKCYICQKTFPLSEYSRHTKVCIRRCSAKPKGNLLSALEQTESKDTEAGPSTSKLQSGEVIDLRDKDISISGFQISSSPIRTFTAISEASDCLIDFKNQHRVKRSNRRRR